MAVVRQLFTQPDEKGQKPLTYCDFYDSDKPNYIFANYWVGSPPVVLQANIQGVACTFNSPEQLFHAQKFKIGSAGWNAVMAATTPDAARDASRDAKYTRDYDPQWRKNKNPAFEVVIRARCAADPAFLNALMKTGDSYIVEDTYYTEKDKRHDIYNGAGPDGMGSNDLGKCLMKIRLEQSKIPPGPLSDAENKAFEANFQLMRDRAQDERKKINSILGNGDEKKGAQITYGQSMSQIHQLLNAELAKRAAYGAAPVPSALPATPPSSPRATAASSVAPDPSRSSKYPPAGSRLAAIGKQFTRTLTPREPKSCDNVSDTIKTASSDISKAVNQKLRPDKQQSTSDREEPPIIRKGNQKDTFKFAFENDEQAKEFIAYLKKIPGMDTSKLTYHAEKGQELYPMKHGDKVLGHIVRFEVPKEAEKLLADCMPGKSPKAMLDTFMKPPEPQAQIRSRL